MELLKKAETETPEFAKMVIEPLTDKMVSHAETFAKSHYWSGQESINVHEICGTKHPDYCNKSWLDLLKYGKRMDINLRLLKENPNYYYETVKKEPDMHFLKIDDKIYITHDGNHRSAIAKFLFYYEGKTMLHGVNFHEYLVNTSFQTLYEKCRAIINMQNLPLEVEILRHRVKRIDTAGWMREFFDLKLLLKKRNNTYQQEIDESGMQDFVSESENPFRRFVGKYKIFWR